MSDQEQVEASSPEDGHPAEGQDHEQQDYLGNPEQPRSVGSQSGSEAGPEVGKGSHGQGDLAGGVDHACRPEQHGADSPIHQYEEDAAEQGSPVADTEDVIWDDELTPDDEVPFSMVQAEVPGNATGQDEAAAEANDTCAAPAAEANESCAAPATEAGAEGQAPRKRKPSPIKFSHPPRPAAQERQQAEQQSKPDVKPSASAPPKSGIVKQIKDAAAARDSKEGRARSRSPRKDKDKDKESKDKQLTDRSPRRPSNRQPSDKKSSPEPRSQRQGSGADRERERVQNRRPRSRSPARPAGATHGSRSGPVGQDDRAGRRWQDEARLQPSRRAPPPEMRLGFSRPGRSPPRRSAPEPRGARDAPGPRGRPAMIEPRMRDGPHFMREPLWEPDHLPVHLMRGGDPLSRLLSGACSPPRRHWPMDDEPAFRYSPGPPRLSGLEGHGPVGYNQPLDRGPAPLPRGGPAHPRDIPGPPGMRQPPSDYDDGIRDRQPRRGTSGHDHMLMDDLQGPPGFSRGPGHRMGSRPGLPDEFERGGRPADGFREDRRLGVLVDEPQYLGRDSRTLDSGWRGGSPPRHGLRMGNSSPPGWRDEWHPSGADLPPGMQPAGVHDYPRPLRPAHPRDVWASDRQAAGRHAGSDRADDHRSDMRLGPHERMAPPQRPGRDGGVRGGAAALSPPDDLRQSAAGGKRSRGEYEDVRVYPRDARDARDAREVARPGWPGDASGFGGRDQRGVGDRQPRGLVGGDVAHVYDGAQQAQHDAARLSRDWGRPGDVYGRGPGQELDGERLHPLGVQPGRHAPGQVSTGFSGSSRAVEPGAGRPRPMLREELGMRRVPDAVGQASVEGDRRPGFSRAGPGSSGGRPGEGGGRAGDGYVDRLSAAPAAVPPSRPASQQPAPTVRGGAGAVPDGGAGYGQQRQGASPVQVGGSGYGGAWGSGGGAGGQRMEGGRDDRGAGYAAAGQQTSGSVRDSSFHQPQQQTGGQQSSGQLAARGGQQQGQGLGRPAPAAGGRGGGAGGGSAAVGGLPDESAAVWYYLDPDGIKQGPCCIQQFKQWIKTMSNRADLRQQLQQFESAHTWNQADNRRRPLHQVLKEYL